MARKTLAQADPRVTGGRYLSGYWSQDYTVTSLEIRHGVLWLTVQWHAWTPDSDPRVSPHWDEDRVTVHCTRWDARRDVILSQPCGRHAPGTCNGTGTECPHRAR